MQRHLLRPVQGMALFIAALSMAACARGGADPAEQAAAHYREAAAQVRKGEYQAAIEGYRRGLDIDTLVGPSSMQALFEKRRLEGLVGSYEDAFASSARLERRYAGLMPDSLRLSLAADRSSWLDELGRYAEAAASLEEAGPLPEALRLRQAELHLRAGEPLKAVGLCRSLTASRLPVAIRLQAWSGLLRVASEHPASISESVEPIARKVVALSARLLSSKADPSEKISALRAAAGSLVLVEKHRRDASYLLFKALAVAEEHGSALQVQVLRMEANAVVVRKAQPYREAAGWFGSRNLQYAQAQALLQLAEVDGVDDEERVASLRQAFAGLWFHAPPWPSADEERLEREGMLRLNGELLAGSRIFELFDAAEQVGMIRLQRALQRSGATMAPALSEPEAADDALMLQAGLLLRDIGGLLQRKSRVVSSAEGMAMISPADQAINMKRGQLLELIPKLRSRNPGLAEALALRPVTLRTVQGALAENQVALKPIYSESLCAAMLLGKRHLQIVDGGSLQEAPPACRLLIGSGATLSDAERTAAREWFASVLYRRQAALLQPYGHIVLVCHDPFPFLGNGGGEDALAGKRISSVNSFKELVIHQAGATLPAASSTIRFFRASDADAPFIHKLSLPHDRVFLHRGSLDAEEQELMAQAISREMTHTASPSAALLELRKVDGSAWRDVSAYGIE